MNKTKHAETDNKLDITLRKIAKTNHKLDTTFKKITEILMTIYVLFYLCIFPSATHNKYYDVLMFRYDLFWKPTLGYIVIFCLLGIIYAILKKRTGKTGKTEEIEEIANPKESKSGKSIEQQSPARKFHPNRMKHLWHSLTTTDKFFTLLFIEMILSTVFAPYVYEAFWGSRGRHMGLFIWIFFYAAYILITRFYRPKTWHLYAILIATLFPCIWGICNFFMLNPFGYLDDVDPFYLHTFASTFGNINTYSGYTGIALALSTATFILTEDDYLMVLSLIVMVVNDFAHVMSISDNGILSLAAIYALLPFIAWKKDSGLVRYILSAGLFLLTMLISGIAFLQMPDTMNMDGQSILIALGLQTSIRMLTFAVLLVAMALIIKKKKSKTEILNERQYTMLRKIWARILLLCITAVVMILVVANSGVNLDFFTKYQNILIFNDDWGTGRGLNWRLAFDFYLYDSGIHQKLIGNGPDTYFIITMDRYRKIMEKSGYGIFDSAHSEYIEYLVTIGVFGLIFYLGTIFSSLKRGIEQKNLMLQVAAIACFAYILQASVNIAVPILTPIFILLIDIASLKLEVAHN